MKTTQHRSFYVLFLACLFTLNLRAQYNEMLLQGFDKKAAVDEMNSKNIPDADRAGYLRYLQAKYIQDHHYHYDFRGPGEQAFKNYAPPSPMSGFCPNAGFENYNFSNWQAYSWALSGVDWSTPAVWVNGVVSNGLNASINDPGARHTVLTIPPGNNNPCTAPVVGYDSMAINPTTGLAEIPFVCPSGSGVSVRLGNAQVGSQTERLTYTMNVSAANAQFMYNYAVVLNAPDPPGTPPAQQTHTSLTQPLFTIRILDQNGNIIGGNCGTYAVTTDSAANPNSGFIYNANGGLCPGSTGFGQQIYYKKWTSVGIDLTPQIGTNVTIEFRTYDCSQGGHFGYAYIDCDCGNSQIAVNFCQGANTSVMVAPAGFSSYQWFGPNNMNPVAGGTNDTLTIVGGTLGSVYTCQATSASGCHVQFQATLVNTNVHIQSLSSTPSCATGNSGSVSVVPSGSSNGIYNYVWTNSSSVQVGTTQTVSGLPVGTYSITVSSPGCGQADSTIAITITPPLFTTSSHNYCGSATFIPAPAGSNYVWYNAAGTQIPAPLGDTLFATNITAGAFYTVVYTTPNGCKDSLKIVLNQVSGGSLFVNNINHVCEGSSNGTATVNINTSQAAPYTWQINGPNGFNSAATNAATTYPLTGLSAGTYSITAFDGQCFYNSTFNIDTIKVPVSISVNPQCVAPGDTAHVTFSYGQGGSPQGCQLASTGCMNPTVSTVGTSSGQNTSTTYPTPYGNWWSNEKYQILYTAADLQAAGVSAGKLSSIAFEVTQIPTTPSGAAMNATFLGYTIKIACTATSDLGAGSFGSPFITAPFVTVFGPQTVTATTGWNTHNFIQSYEWDGVSNIIIEICYAWVAPSTYTCNAIVNKTNTSYYSYSTYGSDSQVACSGTTISQTMQSRPVTRFGHCLSQAQPSDFTYNWSPATGVLAPTSPISGDTVVDILTPVTQFYTLTTTTVIGGCTKVDTFTVSVINPFNLSVSADTVMCSNHAPITISAITTDPITGAPVVTTGSWTGPGITNLGNGLATFQPDLAGPGTFNLIYLAGASFCASGAYKKDTVHATVHPYLSANFSGIGPFCVYDTAITLSALSAVTTGSSWLVNGATATQFNPSIVGPSTAPHHAIKHIVDQGFGCPDSSTVYVVVYAKPSITFVSDIIEGCMPSLPIAFTSTVSIPGGTYLWNFGDLGTSNLDNPVHIYNAVGTYGVTAYYTSADGCKDTAVVNPMITVHPLPLTDFLPDPVNTTTLSPHIDFTNMTPDPGNNMIWHWNLAGLDSSDKKNTAYEFTGWGQFDISLTATNQFGCKATVMHPVFITPDCVLYIPNAFTPNGDGRNDVFMPAGEGIMSDDYSMSIYDRWGEKFFETKDINTGWNGQFNNNGVKVEGEVYVYRITFKNQLGKSYSHTGQLTLVR